MMKLKSGSFYLGNENYEFEENETDIKKEKGSDVEGKLEQAPLRDHWDRPIEFLLSCISMSAGLGSVWRFPFVAFNNGGGAFLIPYVLVLCFVGWPLYYMELCMGQFASYSNVEVWNVVPALKGIGYGQAVASWTVTTYYMSLVAITIFYLFYSFSNTLPWASCPQNISGCIDASTNLSEGYYVNSTSSSELYFANKVLHRNPEGLDEGLSLPDLKLSICLLAAWIILFFIMVKGIKSSGKSAYVTALFPYIILFTLLGRGVILPGAVDGIKYFVTPQWEKLLEPSVWYEAVGQCLFSLNLGFGPVIMFASYNQFTHNIYRDAAILSCTDTLSSFAAGITIFAILGHLAYLMEFEDINLVIKGGGSSLVFISYPDAISRFQYFPQLFSILFFLMLLTLGIGSAAAQNATIITIVCDEFPRFRRPIVTLVVCISGFLVGLIYVTPEGSYLLDLVDHYGATFVIYMLAFLEVIGINWIYGYKNFIRDIKFMLNRKTGYFWAFCWVFLIPVLLFFIFIYTLIDQEPLTSGPYIFGPGANGIGICITVFAMTMVPLIFVLIFNKSRKRTKNISEAFKACFKPNSEWGPKDPVLKKQYKEITRTRKSVILLTRIQNKDHVELPVFISKTH